MQKSITIILIKHCCRQGIDKLHIIMNFLRDNGFTVVPLVRQYYMQPEVRNIFISKGINYDSSTAYYICPEADNTVFTEQGYQEGIQKIKDYYKSRTELMEYK